MDGFMASQVFSMLPNPRKITFKLKTPENGFPDSTFLAQGNPTPLDDDDDDDDFLDISSDDDRQDHSNSRQIVLYDPQASGSASASLPLPEPTRRRFPFLCQQPSRPLPSVGAFTVQCAKCFKWRLIPSKDKYEEIREHILELPFFCETARQWRPDVSCDLPPDISQDGSRLWAIDKPNIALPPPGWQRLLRIRGQGSTKFADVYYVAPSGKRLRSMVEIEKYLSDHPELRTQGVSMSQFSFRTPKPLQENYVRKRPRPLAPCDGLDPDLVTPLAWAGPDESTALQLGLSEDRPAKRTS